MYSLTETSIKPEDKAVVVGNFNINFNPGDSLKTCLSILDSAVSNQDVIGPTHNGHIHDLMLTFY